MQSGFSPRPFGNTGLVTSALGLGSSFGLPAKEVERSFERGVSFFLWGSLRKSDFGLGLRNLAPKHREEMIVAVQSYTRFASLMEWSVDRSLRFLKTDYVDILCLAWWNGPPPRRIIDAALDLSEQRRPGTVAFTATRWGTLLQSKYVPEGAATPRASDCYRFSLSNPSVDVCLAGPNGAEQLDEALVALWHETMSWRIFPFSRSSTAARWTKRSSRGCAAWARRCARVRSPVARGSPRWTCSTSSRPSRCAAAAAVAA